MTLAHGGSRVGARVVGLVAGGLLLLSVAVPANADSGHGIRSVRVVGNQLQLVVTNTTLTQRIDAQQTRLVVRVDGQVVPARITSVAGRPGAQDRRSALLLVDTSGSMAGAGIAGAKRAAIAFVNEVPSDVLVGLTAFAGTVQPLVAPTLDHTALQRGIAGLRAAGETTLYDGILSALPVLGATGTRRIVLLSDGADSRSSNRLPSVIAQLRASGVALSVVEFGGRSSGDAALRELAGVSGDRPVQAADASSIAAAFTRAARTFDSQVNISAVLPSVTAGRFVDVVVSLGSGSRVAAASTRVQVPGPAAVAHPSRAPAVALAPGTRSPSTTGWFGSRASLPWAVAATFAGLLVLAVATLGAVLPSSGDGRRTRALMAGYTLAGRGARRAEQEPGAIGNSTIARTALELTGRVTARRGLEASLRAKLERAALPVEPREWVLLQFVLAVSSVCVLVVLLANLLIAVPVGLLVGWLGPRLVLSVRATRRQRAFLDQMPDSLQLMAGALSSGFSLLQALGSVVGEGAEPMASELGRALSEARIGVPIEQALEAVADRMECEDFRWVVMAMRIQREVGGNLAGVLTTVVATLRDRARLRRQVRTLSAEGRLSAWILIALPILLGLYELLFRGSYFRPMYTTPLGLTLLGGTAVSMTVGAVWMNKLVKVEA